MILKFLKKSIWLSYFLGSFSWLFWSPSVVSAPVKLTLDHTPILSANPYEDLIINAIPNPDEKINELILLYRPAGKRLFESSKMNRGSDGVYTGVIPSSFITPKGLVYFIAALDKNDREIMLFGSPERPHAVSTRSVVVIKSSDLLIYEDVLQGLKRETKIAYKIFTLKQLDEGNQRFISKLEKQPPEVIVTLGVESAQLIRNSSVSKKVPVIYSMLADPRAPSLVTPFSTGVSFDITVKKYLTSFKKVIPKVKKVGIIYDPSRTGPMVQEARALAPSMGFEILAMRIEEPGEVEAILRAFEKDIDALWITPDGTVLKGNNFQILEKFSHRFRIPLFVFSQDLVRQGALVGLSPDYFSVGIQTGILVQKILDGTSPKNLPVKFPEKVRVSLNMQTADDLQLKGIAQRVVDFAAQNDYPLRVYK